MHIATGPLLHLPQGVHGRRVGAGVRALEVLVPVGGGHDAAAAAAATAAAAAAGLGGVLLKAHVGGVRGVALVDVLEGGDTGRVGVKVKVGEWRRRGRLPVAVALAVPTFSSTCYYYLNFPSFWYSLEGAFYLLNTFDH